MKQEDLERVKQALSKASPLVKEIETLRKSKLIIFISYTSLSHWTAFRLNKVVRKLGKIENMDLMIESLGGDIDSATKIVKTLKAYCTKLSVIIPFFAKSAASVIALAADEIVMCKDGELGPIDPQVLDPASRMYIPAHSIKEAIGFIEELKDTVVKLSLAEKIPPLLMGAYRESQKASEQYLNDAFGHLGDKKAQAIETFSEKYLSHGYPIDRKLCTELGLNVTEPDEELEEKICNLHEIYEDLALTFIEREGEEHEHDILLIQGDGQRCVVFGNEDITSQVMDGQSMAIPSQEAKIRTEEERLPKPPGKTVSVPQTN